jgi:hypothetical protein
MKTVATSRSSLRAGGNIEPILLALKIRTESVRIRFFEHFEHVQQFGTVAKGMPLALPVQNSQASETFALNPNRFARARFSFFNRHAA